jgi:hypothetical protein
MKCNQIVILPIILGEIGEMSVKSDVYSNMLGKEGEYHLWCHDSRNTKFARNERRKSCSR